MKEDELKTRINDVVEARKMAQGATEERTSAYQEWVEENQQLLDNEANAKNDCQEAETLLRGLALQAYAETGNKAPEVGVGIRIMSRLGYDGKEAMGWAMEHKLALKLDSSAFEKIAKTSNLPFVTISEEPQATIATDLQEIK